MKLRPQHGQSPGVASRPRIRVRDIARKHLEDEEDQRRDQQQRQSESRMRPPIRPAPGLMFTIPTLTYLAPLRPTSPRRQGAGAGEEALSRRGRGAAEHSQAGGELASESCRTSSPNEELSFRRRGT